MKIRVPEEFRTYTSGEYNGVYEDYGTLEEVLDQMVKFVTLDERKIVIEFIEKLLSGNHTDQELYRIWSQGRSAYYLVGKKGKEGMHDLFRMHLENLKRHL